MATCTFEPENAGGTIVLLIGRISNSESFTADNGHCGSKLINKWWYWFCACLLPTHNHSNVCSEEVVHILAMKIGPLSRISV